MTPAANDPLTELLARQRVVILDGGLATELEARGHDLRDDLWSARLLLDDSDAIRRLHLDYLDAGADCIVSASYQATLPGLRSRGLSGAAAAELLELSVRLATDARDEFWSRPENRRGRQRPMVAASVGPYGAYLADGSEYTGDYDLDEAGLGDFHRDRLRLLAASGADLLACETIPSAAEGRVLTRLLDELEGPPAWVSFCCRDDRALADGSDFADAAVAAATSHAVLAVGVNCTAPSHLNGLLARLRGRLVKPIVVYPNSGEAYEAATGAWRSGGERSDLETAASRWVDLGAGLVGGCCRTGPEDIRRLRRRLLG